MQTPDDLTDFGPLPPGWRGALTGCGLTTLIVVSVALIIIALALATGAAGDERSEIQTTEETP